MKKFVLLTVGALTLLPVEASAQERGGDAALGALSGALVFGPVGAVAGALVGYTAGPEIARSWGARRSSNSRSRSYPASRTKSPTVSSRDTHSVATTGSVDQTRAAGIPAAPKFSSSAVPTGGVTPPVQALE